MTPALMIFLLKAAEVKGKGGTRGYYMKGCSMLTSKTLNLFLVLKHMAVDHNSTK